MSDLADKIEKASRLLRVIPGHGPCVFSDAEQLEIVARLRASAAIELAYGLLWLAPTDRDTRVGELAYQARQALLPHLDREGRMRGLRAAQDVLPAPASPAASRESRTNPRTEPSALLKALNRGH